MIYTPSLACANQLNLERDISEMIEAGIQMFHADIMDGHYVPNISLSMDTAAQVKSRFNDIKLDVHIMVENPETYIDRIRDTGAELLAFHTDATSFAYRTIQNIKNAGMKAGIVINPSEPVSLIEPILKHVDYVLVMSIEPGFAGQKFIEDSYAKIESLSTARRQQGLQFKISVDGGITPEIGHRLKNLGADMLVLGYPAIFRQENGIVESFKKFKKYVEKG